MSYILIYTMLIGKLEYAFLEPMQSLSQCRRLLPIIEASENVVQASCAAVILDKEQE